MSLRLIDTSTVFWPVYMASGSDLDAYTHLVEYAEGSPPGTVFCLDDATENLERRSVLPEYKTGRPPRPPEAHQALADAIERMRENGVPLAFAEGWEADDCIATLARQAIGDVLIVSSDKDLLVLVGGGTLVMRRGQLLDAGGVKRVTGVPPILVSDWLALGGDSADHIPGCPGVGPGNAAKLLNAFGGLEKLRRADRADILSVRGIGEKTADALEDWFAFGGHTLSLSLTSLNSQLDLDLSSILREVF